MWCCRKSNIRENLVMSRFQFKSVAIVCAVGAVIFASCGAALAQPAWYTPGVGGFNPNVCSLADICYGPDT